MIIKYALTMMGNNSQMVLRSIYASVISWYYPPPQKKQNKKKHNNNKFELINKLFLKHKTVDVYKTSFYHVTDAVGCIAFYGRKSALLKTCMIHSYKL